MSIARHIPQSISNVRRYAGVCKSLILKAMVQVIIMSTYDDDETVSFDTGVFKSRMCGSLNVS